jgi:hypothetical protein
MKNKKSQISTALTWWGAFIIIFFIILLFISASIIVSARKAVNSINFQEYGGSLKAQRSLIVLLNTPIEVQGENMKMKDLMLSSLDPYIEYRDYTKKNVVEKIGGDINEIEVHYPEDGIIDVDFFKETNAKERDRQVREFSKIILDPLCDEYFLKIPQGVIFDKGPDFFARRSLSDSDLIPSGQEDRWGGWASIKLPYKEHIVEIKYKILIRC